MKYIKLFLLLAVAAVGFSACSDDDNEWNSTATTTISLPSDTIRIKENAGIYRIPVTVTGARNGKVKATVKFEGVGDNPAIADSNYYATSNTVTVSADTTDSESFIEIETVDDEDINADRQFKVTITSAEGAQIGNESVVVVLRDNDAEFYDKLQGSWTMKSYGLYDGDTLTWKVNVTGAADESDPDYNKTLYVTGIEGLSYVSLKLSYNYDITTHQGSVSFDDLGNYSAGSVRFSGLGACDVYPYHGEISGNRVVRTADQAAIVGTWSSDFKKVTFEPGIILLGVVQNGSYLGSWDAFRGVTLTK